MFKKFKTITNISVYINIGHIISISPATENTTNIVLSDNESIEIASSFEEIERDMFSPKPNFSTSPTIMPKIIK